MNDAGQLPWPQNTCGPAFMQYTREKPSKNLSLAFEYPEGNSSLTLGSVQEFPNPWYFHSVCHRQGDVARCDERRVTIYYRDPFSACGSDGARRGHSVSHCSWRETEHKSDLWNDLTRGFYSPTGQFSGLCECPTAPVRGFRTSPAFP